MQMNADFWISLIGLAFNGLAWFLLEDVSGMARFFPVCVIALLSLAFLILLFRSLRRKERTPITPDVQEICLVVLSFLYLLGITRWGYVISTFTFMGIAILMLGDRKIHWVLLTSAGVALVLYLLFSRVLLVPLPGLNPGGWF